jgi:hypothetical protein
MYINTQADVRNAEHETRRTQERRGVSQRKLTRGTRMIKQGDTGSGAG